jgi:anti-sigma28 factor (negative regulator of flagellin synthesis)
MDISEFKTNTETDCQEQKTEEIYRMSDVETDPPMGIMDTLTITPLGRLLSIISSLPEIRHEKVSNIRSQIERGEYEINNNLDIALDRVLEEFIAD